MAFDIAIVVGQILVGQMLSPDKRVFTANLPLRQTHTATATITFPTRVSCLMNSSPINIKVEINGQTFVYGNTETQNLPFEKNFFYDAHKIVFSLKLVSDELTVGFKYRKADSSGDFYDDDDDDDSDGDFDPSGISSTSYDPNKYDFILDRIRKKY